MSINGQIKALITVCYDPKHPDGKEWHSVRDEPPSEDSPTYIGERGTDSYELVSSVSFTKDENTAICMTDRATYVVQKRQDDRWFSIAILIPHGYIVPE